MALMLGALTIQGIQPGPAGDDAAAGTVLGPDRHHVDRQPMLVMLNLPLIGLWVKLLKVPYRLLFPASWRSRHRHLQRQQHRRSRSISPRFFGVIGFLWMQARLQPAPMLLGFVLGPMMEEHLRRAMLMSNGDPSVFFTRPISLGFIIATVLILVVIVLPAVRSRRSEIARINRVAPGTRALRPVQTAPGSPCPSPSPCPLRRGTAGAR